MSPSFHNLLLFFPGKAAVSEDRSLPLGSGTHFMPAAISACYQLSFWISHRVGSLEHSKSFEDMSTYFFSHLAQNIFEMWRHATASLAVSFSTGVTAEPWDSPTPGSPSVALQPPWRQKVMWDQPVGLRNKLRQLRNGSSDPLDILGSGTPWCPEPLAEIEPCRHFKSLWSQKKWKSPRTTEIKFRDVYCNPILYTVYRLHPKCLLVLSSSMRLGFVKRACPRNPMDCHRFSPIEMVGLWAIYIIYRIPSFSEIPKSVQSQVLIVKTKLMTFCTNETQYFWSLFQLSIMKLWPQWGFMDCSPEW